MLKIHTIGGYNEVGKNMTALEIDDDVILFDCGLYLPAVVGVQEREKIPTENGMRALGALPDDLYLDKHGLRNKVRAILISHAHLDHVGAVQYLSQRYKAPVLGTPFTIELLKILNADSGSSPIPNKIQSINPNGTYTVKGKSGDYKVEFINATHSTIQCTMIAVHTKKGVILYTNDFKFDNTPILGDKPNYKRLKELSKIGVKAVIADCLYAQKKRKTPSEKIARGLLEDVLFTTDNHTSGIIITTFSSHIARLKSITEFGNKLNRKVVFLGRSLNKYMGAAIKAGKAPFKNKIQIATYRNQLERVLKSANKKKSDYLLVCTGHQGESGAILDRLSRNKLPYKLSSQDHIIFSSKTIPTSINEKNKADLDNRLKKFQPRMFNNVHVSVLPNTEVVINDENGMKIKEICKIRESEKSGIKVPSFDPKDLKIKWYDARVVKHPYEGKIFKIFTKSGRNVSITSGHSLFKLDNGKIIAETGDNLKEHDFLAIPKKFKWYKEIKHIKIDDYLDIEKNKHYRRNGNLLYYDKKPISKLKIDLNNEFAKLLGYYLAECSSSRHISLVIGKHETEILGEIKNSIKKCFPSNINIYDKGSSYEINFGARNLKKLFKTWFGENAKTKKIPKFVFSASEEFKLNFLGAYINGDGSIDKGKDYFRIRIKTASKKLASDLLYLFTHIGICAKFDHIENGKRRKIAGNKKWTEETKAYVIRIQNIEYLAKLKPFLSEKYKSQIEKKQTQSKFSQKFPPEALPINKLNFAEIDPKKGTFLSNIKNYYENSKNKKHHVSQDLIFKQSKTISGFTRRIINGDLFFDPIVKIKTSEYKGIVYDFHVPGPENFIGGFGGIILHNSGHGGKEDIRDLFKLTNPERIIPSHGDIEKRKAGFDLAIEMGYKKNSTVHLMDNQKALILK